MATTKRALQTIIIAALMVSVSAVFAWSNGQQQASSSTTTAASNAQSQLTPVTFRLNWKYTGPHAAYFLGKKLGYYEQQGIDLRSRNRFRAAPKSSDGKNGPSAMRCFKPRTPSSFDASPKAWILDSVSAKGCAQSRFSMRSSEGAPRASLNNLARSHR